MSKFVTSCLLVLFQASTGCVTTDGPSAERNSVTYSEPFSCKEMGDQMMRAECQYSKQVQRQIGLVWNYPESERRKGHEGDVEVKWVVRKDGQVSDIEIVKSTGHDGLDRAILQTFKDAAPFSPLPKELNKTALPMSGTFKFKLGPATPSKKSPNDLTQETARKSKALMQRLRMECLPKRTVDACVKYYDQLEARSGPFAEFLGSDGPDTPEKKRERDELKTWICSQPHVVCRERELKLPGPHLQVINGWRLKLVPIAGDEVLFHRIDPIKENSLYRVTEILRRAR